MKKARKKLTLQRESLRMLQTLLAEDLDQVHGGGARLRNPADNTNTAETQCFDV